MIDIDEGFFKAPSLSTAGAISVRNAKGQLVTQKVKVHRYVAGKRPDYAEGVHVSDDEEDDRKEHKLKHDHVKSSALNRIEQEDRRIRRLQGREEIHDDDRLSRHRRIIEPEVLEQSSDEEIEQQEDEDDDDEGERMDEDDNVTSTRVKMEIESSDDDEELDEEQIERRRQRLRLKAKVKEEELLQVEDEKEPEQDELEASEESESEEDDEEEEDDDDGVPRLKPVFVRKTDRRTVAEREAEEKHQLQLEIEKKRLADQRKMQTQKIVEEAIRQERLKEKETDDGIECDFNTDDEDGETAYDAWKLRELKRLKRDREERDQREREKQELERWHNMTEEEREAELKKNPKIIDNKVPKAKYKFLQKYYHRGAFFMDKDEDILKRDYSSPTLEDHFDKTVLPKVMQVKNFGMAGRTKYTHLVDQDTTIFESPWASDKQSTKKFFQEHGGGLKQVFERPKLKNTSKKNH
ncbi:unnamed protein product [Rotaria socialis]|uniref:Micro-fibrillar-associated protein 1 C-terminal domain-containing protein n=1 Tax=Rotaria socialis TaxID=392032 RepID=A0A818LAG7_9BILA|nr:unnamed protein product [Rotaria socialis]CAF4408332.1 unnamed protein product [Rotaria socialis]